MKSKKERIEAFLYIVQNKGYTPTEISEKTGFDRGNISKMINHKTNISVNFLKKFEEVYQINLNEIQFLNNTKTTRFEDAKYLKNGVPYYDVDFAGGWSSEEVFANQLPSFYITSPDFEKAEFACNLIGQSISRRIPNRAVLGLRQIKDWEMYFPTNEVYAVLMKNDLRTVKIVKRSKKDGFLTLIPDPLPEFNQTEYESEEVPVNFVAKMFQVVAWAQFERVAM